MQVSTAHETVHNASAAVSRGLDTYRDSARSSRTFGRSILPGEDGGEQDRERSYQARWGEALPREVKARHGRA